MAVTRIKCRIEGEVAVIHLEPPEGKPPTLDSNVMGELKLLGTPVYLKGTPPQLQECPPRLGQHNRDVALEVGYSEEKVAQMAEKGVFG